MAHWLDNPHNIVGGKLFGQLAGHSISDPAVADYADAESSTFANRTIHITTHQFSTLPPANLANISALISGGLGHAVTPMMTALGELNLGTPDAGWPAVGCAAFTNGSMDSTLQAWCDLWNALPAQPILVRPWREMNTTPAPWGASGSLNGGVNETSGTGGTYVTAWRYIVTYIRARCPNVRFGWCPALIGGSVLADYTAWYPGDAYVDWNLCDGYIARAAFRSLSTIFTEWYGGFNSVTGTVSRKPAGVAETQVDQTDPSRAADYATYQTAFGSGGPFNRGIYFVNFWNGANAGSQYRINDAPAGSLAAYQTMVGSAPFVGSPDETFYGLAVDGSGHLVLAAG